MIRYSKSPTPLGLMVFAAEDDFIVGVWFEGQRHFAGVGEDWLRVDDDRLLKRAVRQLDEYFAGTRQQFDLPTNPGGTAFQREVWRGISDIGYGATATYKGLAEELGRPSGSRAVGAATGRNPLSIIVPCHRVLASDGALTGYAGGLEKKRALLELENRRTAEMAQPALLTKVFHTPTHPSAHVPARD